MNSTQKFCQIVVPLLRAYQLNIFFIDTLIRIIGKKKAQLCERQYYIPRLLRSGFRDVLKQFHRAVRRGYELMIILLRRLLSAQTSTQNRTRCTGSSPIRPAATVFRPSFRVSSSRRGLRRRTASGFSWDIRVPTARRASVC